MLQSLRNNTPRDFRSRYANTYGFYTKGDKRTLVFFTDVNDNNVSWIDQDGADYQSSWDSDITFQFLAPQRKVFMHRGSVMYMCRIPARQWQRGIALGNTRLTKLSTRQHSTLSFQKLLSAFYTDNDRNLVSVGAFLKGIISEACVNDMFAFTGDRVWLYNQCIGTILKTDGEWSAMVSELYSEEFSTAVKSFPLTVLSHKKPPTTFVDPEPVANEQAAGINNILAQMEARYGADTMEQAGIAGILRGAANPRARDMFQPRPNPVQFFVDEDRDANPEEDSEDDEGDEA
jgi:hypothetical protein